jgi:hypothetical protein
MKYRFLKNLRSSEIQTCDQPHMLGDVERPSCPRFDSKAAYREWCADQDTGHVFYSGCAGDARLERITAANPVGLVTALVADYDAPVDWDTILPDLQREFAMAPPTWVSRTYSGYMRVVWEFENPLPVTPEIFEPLMKQLRRFLRLDRAFAGFDEASLRATQYFEVGSNWLRPGGGLSAEAVVTSLIKATAERPPSSSDVSIPIEDVSKEVMVRFPDQMPHGLDIGTRVPLFWIPDGIAREGGIVVEDGVVCFSDRAGTAYASWSEILGRNFAQAYEQAKLGNILDHYWFDGKTFHTLLDGNAVFIMKEQLVLELRSRGLTNSKKKGQALSEVEAAVLAISQQNRIEAIAPLVFSADRIVRYSSRRILNTADIRPVQPAPVGAGVETNWPFIHKWLTQLFEDDTTLPTVNFFHAWMKRFYEAALHRIEKQGQALILVGPTNKGKSLLSNRVISALVGGHADASDYVSGHTKFNRDLARVAAWVIDDTTSAASFEDQRKATEIIKRTVANPRIVYHAKYADAIDLPWTGRIIFSLNMDATSLSVIPTLDSSNRDKLMALRVRENATSDFPANVVLEKTIADELPFYARWLLDWDPPAAVVGGNRFGVASHIDETIAAAAYDNSSRSVVAEVVEFFVKKLNEVTPDMLVWEGTLTEFCVQVMDFNGGRPVGVSQNTEFMRRGFGILEDASKAHTGARPVISFGQGGGKLWRIDLDPSYALRMPDPPQS